MRRFKKSILIFTLILATLMSLAVPAFSSSGDIEIKGHIEAVSNPSPTAYTVTYNANGGSGGISETVSNSTYTVLNEESAVVSNSGHYFFGWNTAQDGSGTSYRPGDVITLIGDITLYARWSTKEQFRITYDPNGGTGSLIVIIEVIGGSYDHTVLSADETRTSSEYYTFKGWNTEADGSGVDYQPGFSVTIKGSTTLYAQWDIACHLHYVNGYEDGKFRSDNDISRAEAAQMLCNLMQVNGASTTVSGNTSLFPDVKSGSWYFNAVTYLTQQGIIEGYEDGFYRPKEKITRAEFAALIVRYAGLTASTTPSGFNDVSSSHWASGYISTAVSAGYVVGYEDGTFRPEINIIRAEAVTMLNRVDGRDVDVEDYSSGLAMPFSDVNTTYWAYYQILEASVDHEIHNK